MATPLRRERIPFNRPAVTGHELDYLKQVFARGKFAGRGPFGERCNEWLSSHFGAAAVLITSSGTHALEMAALLCDLEPGDEVILPSFAYPTTASAFVRCGARLVFVDICPSTMNIDPEAVAAAITSRTRVVVALHYAGVSCDMDALRELSREHGLFIVEDAAQAIFANHREDACGTLGEFGCFSFHETKNVHCGEGGALLVNEARYLQRAEMIWEKGTDRARFLRGEVDKYTWRDTGSSYVLSELNSAFLLAQLERGGDITADRLRNWHEYRGHLGPLAARGVIEIPEAPRTSSHNGHIFWIKTSHAAERADLIRFLRERSIHSVFHYIPLHNSPAGRRFGRLAGADRYTTAESARLLRLPLFYGFSEAARVAAAVEEYYGAP